MNRHRLRDLATLLAGTSTRSLDAPADTDLFPVITLKDVNLQLAPADTLAKVAAERRDIDRFQVQEGDVVVTTRGTEVRAGVVQATHAGAIAGANLAVIRLHTALAPTLLAAFLREPRTQAALLRDTAGASTPGFTIRALGELSICVPPPERQQILVEFVAAADEYRAALRQAMQLRQRACDEVISKELSPGDEA